jgi:hypothetical protein
MDKNPRVKINGAATQELSRRLCPCREHSHRVAVLSWAKGTFLAQCGTGIRGSDEGRLYNPRGIRLLRDGLHLIVTDTRNSRLSVFTVRGRFVRTIRNESLGLWCPYDVLETCDGAVIVAGFNDDNLVRLSSDGAVNVYGWGAPTAYAPLVFTKVFNTPTTLAVTNCGVLVVRQLGCGGQYHLFR